MKPPRPLAFFAVVTAGAVLGAIAGLALSSCAPSLQDQQVTVYAGAQAACVAQATSFDAGLVCLQSVQSAFCGKGGVWADASICPDGDLK